MYTQRRAMHGQKFISVLQIWTQHQVKNSKNLESPTLFTLRGNVRCDRNRSIVSLGTSRLHRKLHHFRRHYNYNVTAPTENRPAHPVYTYPSFVALAEYIATILFTSLEFKIFIQIVLFTNLTSTRCDYFFQNVSITSMGDFSKCMIMDLI